MRRAWILAVAAALWICLPACAADDMQDVASVWSRFTASLRCGDYPEAHRQFSEESQNAMPYPEFVAEYGPLSTARELILAKPESQSTNVDGDWAEFLFGGVNPGTGRRYQVGVSLVRNGDGWGLVAARNEDAERIQAGARALLRAAWNARNHAEPSAIAAALSEANADNPVLKFYRIEASADGFVAFPQHAGLRTFYTNALGDAVSMEQPAQGGGREKETAAPQPSGGQKTGPAPAIPASALDNGIPEMTEPPPLSERNSGLDGEMREPPPSPGRSAPPREPANRMPLIELPDAID